LEVDGARAPVPHIAGDANEPCSKYTLAHIEPMRLSVIFRGENDGVDEDQYDDEPVEPLRLDRLATSLTTSMRPLENPLPARNNQQ